MGSAVVALGGAELRQRSRRFRAGLAQAEVLQPGNIDGIKAAGVEFRVIAAEDEVALVVAHAFAFAAPAVMLQSCAGHERFPVFLVSLGQTIGRRRATKKARASAGLSECAAGRDQKIEAKQ